MSTPHGATIEKRWHHRAVPARLYREIIGDNAERLVLITHGIYGSGANWRGIARKVHQQRPEWGIVLVDLRGHGRSEPGEPPHTVAACAADLRALFDELPIEVIAGHSFGGKVVLATRALAPPTLRQTWVLDASPSARPGAEADPNNSVTRVLELMERLPKTWAKREDFVAAIIADGHAAPLAQWLAMNLVGRAEGALPTQVTPHAARSAAAAQPRGAEGAGASVNLQPAEGGFALRLDLVAVRSMLHDYYRQDLWHVALDPALPGELHVVIAERSRTLDDDDRARLATAPPHVHVHRVDAGHWLHIEAPANVVDLMTSSLPTPLP
jgi:esterase